MKNIFYLLLLIMVTWGSYSCKDASFLDETVTSDLDIDKIFSDSAYTVGFLSEIYVEIGFDVDPKRFKDREGFAPQTYGGLQGACDEMEFKARPKITTDVLFATGTVTPVSVSNYTWKTCYANIRSVNIFLQNVDRAPLTDGLKQVYKAEARVLRAWYYGILLRHYGGIPLIGEDIYDVHDDIPMKRHSYEECMNYIISECNEVMRYLEIAPRGRDFGRVGQGACKAFIARLRLYAASPLFNGSDFGAEKPELKELVGFPTADPDRWRLAAEAAAEVIALQRYSLYTVSDDDYFGEGAGFAKLFQASSSQEHSGHILDWRRNQGWDREQLFQPPSRGSNTYGGYPYQELVDAFPMIDGTPFDWNNSAHASAPYENRDKRFYHSIYYDQTVIMQRADAWDIPLDIYLNKDGTPSSQDAVYLGTPTGYYNGKMLDRRTAGNYIHESQQSIPLIRYAEILLNYAEAQNEAGGPTSVAQNLGSYDVTPYTVLIEIRKRAGIQPGSNELYGLKENMTQDEMREVIRNERRIELAVEGHRFWDVRRWMIAEETENRTFTGMEVKLNEDGTKSYTRFNVRQHVFRSDRAMYLWPLPYNEVIKSSDMLQNPYYND
ncbi:MAG: RagB/SusD family nutrient uptake outer membrane protein [Dysgonomonas sp.]|nr:RagB/SusD family nutrient uptake outer membrane protein [Dysgonomonas sp.]